MKYLLCVAAALLLNQNAFSQSVREYATQRQITMQSQEAGMRWRAAKKLSLVKDKKIAQPSQKGCLFVDEMQVGDVGRIDYWHFTVLSIVDSRNVILSLGIDKLVWLEDFPTEGMSDNEAIHIIDTIKVTGIKKYEAVSGTVKNVKAIKLLPEIESKELDKAKREQAAETFTLKGNKSIRGRFVDYSDGTLVIENTDGDKIDIDFGQVTPETAAKIRSLMKAKAQTKKKGK